MTTPSYSETLALFRIEADWYGGGFGYTARFADRAEAMEWALFKSRFHADAVITVEAR